MPLDKRTFDLSFEIAKVAMSSSRDDESAEEVVDPILLTLIMCFAGTPEQLIEQIMARIPRLCRELAETVQADRNKGNSDARH